MKILPNTRRIRIGSIYQVSDINAGRYLKQWIVVNETKNYWILNSYDDNSGEIIKIDKELIQDRLNKGLRKIIKY